MTVVFIDLVGSTALGGDLDPEDLIDLLRLYRDACVEVIGKYDGFIAQYLGDGILVYFGFPVAQEHAAERAVRAALEIVEKVGRLKRPDGQPLQTRVGIATGLVVAGEAGGVGPAGEETVVGDTPNLAARLQSEAEPGCVLVSSSTHRITEDFFEYSFLGTHAIKGLPFDAPRSLTPDQVYAVCAYVLFLNHLVPEGAVLDAASLPKIEMPNRAGFVSAYPPRSEDPAPWLNPPTWKYAEGDYDDRRFAQLYDGAGPPQRLAETL
jgi:class 3 adenylate cyclase